MVNLDQFEMQMRLASHRALGNAKKWRQLPPAIPIAFLRRNQVAETRSGKDLLFTLNDGSVAFKRRQKSRHLRVDWEITGA